MKNLHVKILALLLVIIGTGLTYYKVTRLGLPILPAEQTEVWMVEARLEFEAKGNQPVKARFHVPSTPLGFTVVDEDFISTKYGLTMEDNGINRIAQWAVRRAKGKQVLYYRVELAPEVAIPVKSRSGITPPFPAVPDYPEPMGSVVQALLEEVRRKSADVASFTGELLVRLNAPNSDENVQVLRKGIEDPIAWVDRVIYILAGARIPARIVHLLQLKDGINHGTLTPWLEVHNGQEWLAFDPKTGSRGFPENGLIWYVGNDSLINLEGGGSPKVEYSISSQFQELVLVAERRARQINSLIMDFSLFSLPVQTQNVYRVLLLIPIGAFLIVVLRNIVGIKTFGTFMPILIALAFRETDLLWGVLLFTGIVALGLLLRFYLEYLKLLLVPRLASVLVMVILLMAVISVLTHKMGLERGLSVALFPMVILTMTIERMSLVWEEHGPGEALQQGLGSLLVAVLGYLLMTDKLLEHLVFVFPELLLVVLAMTLLVGRYAGYRLTELWRFKEFLRKTDTR
ncbi:conserved hypothetical protein [Nitrosococcus halophilus Nc 4]|uniref:Inactive transglutaminase fused to 7 transmembrane helices n=1 Tax=Nitrosococcus halophilus (strain Nc4) TaxID=472759 RepID=D5C4H8_NITHN|nr:inactive transglutaminase family protein [Nitrosococcus halophilus]ADE15162.1 conserved hypothetical protein [Nitrosococcus halophilus Nc 4]